jgi:uncharacterized membrane protein
MTAQTKLGGPPFDNNTSNAPKPYLAICDNNTNISSCEFLINKNDPGDRLEPIKRPFVFRYHMYVIPFAAMIGFIFGLIVFWAMTDKVIKIKQNLANNTDVILKMLPTTHRAIIQHLLNNNGKSRQYELLESTNLNKVKIHRVLRDLEDDNIIIKEKIGKVNNIILNKDIFEILKEEKQYKK